MTTTSPTPTTPTGTSVRTAPRIDPRGPRFTAGVTVAVLAAILLLPATAATALTAVQTVLFALGVGLGVQRTPTAWVFRTLVRPRLGAPGDLEDPAPPRFAQGVGLAFAVVALAAYVAGATVVAQVAIGLALVAAVLNAVFGLCLGCEMYLLLRRLRPTRTTPA